MKLHTSISPRQHTAIELVQETVHHHYECHGCFPGWVYVSCGWSKMMGIKPNEICVVHGCVCVGNYKMEGVSVVSMARREA